MLASYWFENIETRGESSITERKNENIMQTRLGPTDPTTSVYQYLFHTQMPNTQW